MDKQLWIEIAKIGGVIFSSGLVSAVVSFKLNQRKDKAEFLQGKLEILYDVTHRWSRQLWSHYLHLTYVYKNETSYEEFVQNFLVTEIEGGLLEKAEMLIGMYFPSMNSELRKLLQKRESLEEFTRYADKNRTTTYESEDLNRLSVAIFEFNKESGRMLESIAKKSRFVE